MVLRRGRHSPSYPVTPGTGVIGWGLGTLVGGAGHLFAPLRLFTWSLHLSHSGRGLGGHPLGGAQGPGGGRNCITPRMQAHRDAGQQQDPLTLGCSTGPHGLLGLPTEAPDSHRPACGPWLCHGLWGASIESLTVPQFPCL